MQTGWAGAGLFVLPDTVIGPKASDVTFQTLDRGHIEYTTAGTLEAWKKEIAARAVGNPLLMLALSVGFASPAAAAHSLGERRRAFHRRQLHRQKHQR